MINSTNILKALAAAVVFLAIAVYKWGRYFSNLNTNSGTPQAKTARELNDLASKGFASSSAITPGKIQNARKIPLEDNLIQLITLLSQKILKDGSWSFEGAFRKTGSMSERDMARKELYAMEARNYADGVDKLNNEGEFATTLLKGLVIDLEELAGQDAIKKLQDSPLTELLTKVSSTDVTLLKPDTLKLAFRAIQNLNI